MADNSGIIKVAAVGVAAYVAYTQGWLSFLGIGTAAASTAATTATSTTTPATPVTIASTPAAPAAAAVDPKANVLDGIYARMVAAANAPSQGLGVDAWGYYLNQQLAPLGLSAPDPQPLFASMVAAANQVTALNGGTPLPAFDRSTFLVTGPAYWNVMAPALRSQLGLSGLGVIGGLGLYMVTSQLGLNGFGMYWRTN